MGQISEFQVLIARTINDSNFRSKPAELYDPIEYTMKMGGKRIRPLLTLLACDMFGGNIEHALNPAIAVEIFHNFTLLHDDIMDQSPIRRNAPTVWKKWNENIAVLSGDTMLIMAYDYLMKTREDCLYAILKLFNRTAAEVCQGQQYDMNFETAMNVSLADYLMMIRLKTAVLLACSLQTGAVIAGAEKEDSEMIYEFGVHLGMAFQLMDDHLDVFGDQEKFGKISGNDIITNKKTILYLKAYELAGPDDRQLLDDAFAIENPQQKVFAVTALYKSLGIDVFTINTIKEYHQQAVDSLNSIMLEKEKKSDLLTIAEKLIQREF